MELNSPLIKCLITVGLVFLAGTISAYFLARRYGVRPKPIPLLAALPALLLVVVFLLAPLCALSFWYDYISGFVKVALIIWLVGFIVVFKIYIWRKYHILWGLPRDCYGKESSEESKN